MKFEIFGIDQLEKESGVKIDTSLMSESLSQLVRDRFGANSSIVNIVFVDSEEMRRINLQSRKIDSSTDVLSFNMPDESEIFGEVYVSLTDVLENVEVGNSLINETLRMIIHGVLHLFGYEHEDYFDENRGDKEMIYKIQEEMLDDLKEKMNL